MTPHTHPSIVSGCYRCELGADEVATVNPKRIRLRRSKGWRLPDNARSVARPTRWGNPWRVGQEVEVTIRGAMWGPGSGNYDAADPCWFDVTTEERTLTAEQAVWLYNDSLLTDLADPDPYFDDLRAALTRLRGHDLACWCSPDSPCHADVLLQVANKPVSDEAAA